MPKGSQGTKRSNKEDSSGGQNSKASRHTACSVYAPIFPARQEQDAEARAAAENAKSAHAEARLATHSSSESSLDQLPWPSFDVDFLNSLQPLEGADGIHAGDPQSDFNDLFPPFASSETSSEGAKSGKRRATVSDIGTVAEDTMPMFLPSLGFDIDPNLPQDELTQVYFDTLHRCFPMVNQTRYRSLSPLMSTDRGIAGLSNAIWLHASSLIPENYRQWEDYCYRSARHHLEKQETEDNNGTFMSIDALQAIILIALYEFKQMYFARAWLTIGKAMVRSHEYKSTLMWHKLTHLGQRLAQMFGLHKMDGNPLTRQDSGFQPGLQLTSDWCQLEERRRTFWVAFNVDWYASSRYVSRQCFLLPHPHTRYITVELTTSPMNIDDKEITTFLPSMDSPDGEQPLLPTRLLLKDALTEPVAPGTASYSPFTGAVIMAGFCGRCLRHLQNAYKASVESEYTYDFWSNHYSIDLAINQTLQSSLKHLNIVPAMDSIEGMADPNTIFLNMNMRATVICLHQAAVVQANKSSLPATLIAESENRTLTAAQEIANIMRLIRTSIHLSKLNMFTTWCLYTAARVLVATLQSARSSTNILDSLQTILSALNAFKISNPRTELFINQINLELGGSFSSPQSPSGSPNKCSTSNMLETMAGAFPEPLIPGSVTRNPPTTCEWLDTYAGQE
ncbi:MAG: hypothetical protein L6R36_006663 [Xanthoria steineri]|nr:MAG: hypothetical protein L6R36_006663 [Xanthoria steineri]